MATYTPHYPSGYSTTYVKATSIFNPTSYAAHFAANPALSLTGPWNTVSWVTPSSVVGDQKWNIDLGSAFIIRRIYLENAHASGVSTDVGIKNINIYGTNDAAAFANTTYANTDDLTLLGTFEASEHVAADSSDPQYILLDNTIAYRYIVSRIADNWGSILFVGIRHMEFQTEDGYVPPVLIKNHLEQTYGLHLGAQLEQIYGLHLGAQLEQIYGLHLGAHIVQWYDNTPTIKAHLVQWYQDAPLLKAHLEQPYDNAKLLIQYLVQKYAITHTRSNFLTQFYNILERTNQAHLEQPYDIKDSTLINAFLNQIYGIEPDSEHSTQINDVTINQYDAAGSLVNTFDLEFITVDVEFSIERWLGDIAITIPKQEDWNKIDFLNEIIFNNDGDEYNFLIQNKYRKETWEKTEYRLTGKSPAMVLDFPYADPVGDEDEFPYGMASDIVIRLAALKGITLDWQIPADGLQTIETVQLEGNSPIANMKKIVRAIGGRLQSDPDGSMYAIPYDEIDSDKYDAAEPDYYLTSGENYYSTETTLDKRDGFNSFYIDDTSSGLVGYKMEVIRVSESESIIKVYQDFWTADELIIETSDLDSATIKRLADVFDEELCEVIEIKEGSGTTSYPVNSIIGYDYKDRTDLGLITANESGDLTTFTDGESQVDFKYFSKYRQWRATDQQTETVQYILKKVEP